MIKQLSTMTILIFAPTTMLGCGEGDNIAPTAPKELVPAPTANLLWDNFHCRAVVPAEEASVIDAPALALVERVGPTAFSIQPFCSGARMWRDPSRVATPRCGATSSVEVAQDENFNASIKADVKSYVNFKSKYGSSITTSFGAVDTGFCSIDSSEIPLANLSEEEKEAGFPELAPECAAWLNYYLSVGEEVVLITQIFTASVQFTASSKTAFSADLKAELESIVTVEANVQYVSDSEVRIRSARLVWGFMPLERGPEFILDRKAERRSGFAANEIGRTFTLPDR